jgi:hypothetical protein
MIGNIAKLSRAVKEAVRSIADGKDKIQECDYCGNVYHSQETLEMHLDNCLEKKKAKDPYYHSNDAPETGICEVDNWHPLGRLPEIGYADTLEGDVSEKLKDELTCHFCMQSFDEDDTIVVKVHDEKGINHADATRFKPFHLHICAFHQQYENGNRDMDDIPAK